MMMDELSWRCYNPECGHTVEWLVTHVIDQDAEWRIGQIPCLNCSMNYEITWNGVTLSIDKE